MMGSLELELLKDFSAEQAPFGWQAFVAHVEGLGKPLGLLYFGPESITFAWPGIVDFRMLEGEVLESLPRRLLGHGFRSLEQDVHVEVALVVTNHADQSSELEQFSLRSSWDVDRYRGVIAEPSRVSFALYDVRSPELTFSFTAENPSFVEHGQTPELEVMLPRSGSFTDDFLRWVVDHHAHRKVRRSNLDLHGIAVALNRAIPAPHAAVAERQVW